MSYDPSIPLVVPTAIRGLVAEGYAGAPLVSWPRGEERHPSVRVLLRATARDAEGAERPFLHVAAVALTGPRELTPFASARVHNREEAPRDWSYLDDGDGIVYAVQQGTGPGYAREVGLRELEHLAARLLGPTPPLARTRDEPYAPALEAGCPVLTIVQAEAEGIPTLAALKASGFAPVATDAADLGMRAALAIGRAFAWTGQAIALPARLPHWNLSCDEAGRVRLTCRVGDPRDLTGWSAGAAFALRDGERALAAAKAVAAMGEARTVTVAGEADVEDPDRDAYDGSYETARAMHEPLRRVLRAAGARLDDPARAAAEAVCARGVPAPGAATREWWSGWAGLSAALPEEPPEDRGDLWRLHLCRLVLDASGYAGPAAVQAEAVPGSVGDGSPETDATVGDGDPGALVDSARLVLGGLEFLVLAQAGGAAAREPVDEALREVSGVAADLMPYLAGGGAAYRQAWEAALQAGLDLRRDRSSRSLRVAGEAVRALLDVDPESFPDEHAAARWAMDLRPRQRAAAAACLGLAAGEDEAHRPEPSAKPFVEPAVTVRRRAPPQRAPRLAPPAPALPRDRVRETAGPPQPPVPEPADRIVVPVVPAAPVVPDAPLPETVPAVGPATAGEGPDVPVPSAPEARQRPTVNGFRVLGAVAGREPLRKTDIADIAGIGRGAANRTVDRLVLDGWMEQVGPNRFRATP